MLEPVGEVELHADMPRTRIVGIFLAVLELVRRGRLRTRQDRIFDEIWLEPAPPSVVSPTTTTTPARVSAVRSGNTMAGPASGISAAPVVDADGRMIGIVSEADLMFRAETGTTQSRSWLQRLLSDDAVIARDYVRSHSRRVTDCQSAFKRDPGSASKRDPPEGRVLTSAHPPSELFGRLTIRAAAGSVGM